MRCYATSLSSHHSDPVRAMRTGRESESVGKTTKCAVFSKECVYVTGAFGDLAVSDGDDDEDDDDDDEGDESDVC